MDYFLHIIVLIAIYTILASSLDLVVGQAGLLSVAHATFYGLGAYISALLAVHLGVSFLIGTLAAMGATALISLLISLPALRLHDDYFVMATFGFQMIVFGILNNWTGLTHGPLGISNIPQPVLFGWSVQSKVGFVLLALVGVIVAYLVIALLTSSPFGRVLRALREDEVLTQALGKNTLRHKTAVFAISASLAALAGSLYAHYFSYIDPTRFTVMESIFIISLSIIGGTASRLGPLIGAILLITLPEILRFIGLPTLQAANLRQILYGVLLIAVVMFRPRGLVGTYSFER